MTERDYLPLADYGLIGDCHGSALVAADGSIDWACLPRFDSPACFSRLLDAGIGGFWRIAPEEGRTGSTIRYAERTAVLETVHETGAGAVLVRDTILPPTDGTSPCVLVRLCEGVAGSVELTSAVRPRLDYGRETATLEPVEEQALRIVGSELELLLTSTIGQQEPDARFTLEARQREAFLLSWGPEPPRVGDAGQLLEDASNWWHAWSDRVSYSGPYEETVVRSAITLKLLSHLPSGAVVAAPTTSLPERIGGDSNWDYRYAWLRDASLTLYALLATGQRDEGDPFFDWVCERVGQADVPGKGLEIMFDLDGRSQLEEEILDELEGYRGSRPVRIGNEAAGQLQLDIYGELLDCFASASAWGREDKIPLWDHYSVLADWICGHWQLPGNGLWELRDERKHYVYSKVMAWVALDRALRTSERLGLPGNVERWSSSAAQIRQSVLERGWSERLGAFKQSFEDDRLDASNVLISLVGFLPADDPRIRSSLDRTVSELSAEGLLYRFRPDEEAGEGAFVTCSYWLVSALVLAGRIKEAVDLFERLLGYASPLGLHAEEIELGTRELLGNFPQAFTHAALITAAVNLARAGGIGEAPASMQAPEGSAHLVPVQA